MSETSSASSNKTTDKKPTDEPTEQLNNAQNNAHINQTAAAAQTPETHLFTLHSEWNGSSDGDGKLRVDRGDTLAYGIPEGTGGKTGRSNPEEMLVGAVVSCYSITLALLLEKRCLPPFAISVEAVGTVVRQPNRRLKFTAIHLRPRIAVYGLDKTQQAAVLELAHAAEHVCLISNALHDDVTITVAPELTHTPDSPE